MSENRNKPDIKQKYWTLLQDKAKSQTISLDLGVYRSPKESEWESWIPLILQDENRHANEWQRCLEKCHEAVKKANNIFNNISSSSVCNEVIKSSEGAEYLTG